MLRRQSQSPNPAAAAACLKFYEEGSRRRHDVLGIGPCLVARTHKQRERGRERRGVMLPSDIARQTDEAVDLLFGENSWRRRRRQIRTANGGVRSKRANKQNANERERRFLYLVSFLSLFPHPSIQRINAAVKQGGRERGRVTPRKRVTNLDEVGSVRGRKAG